MNRRCGWASKRATTSSSRAVFEPNHGDNTPNGAGSWSVWRTNGARTFAPGRAAFLGGAHQYVARAEHEAVPTGAVIGLP